MHVVHPHIYQPIFPPPSSPRRLFLKKLKTTLKIPVLALVDSDPYGLKILSVYMKVGGGKRGSLLRCVVVSSDPLLNLWLSYLPREA